MEDAVKHVVEGVWDSDTVHRFDLVGSLFKSDWSSQG